MKHNTLECRVPSHKMKQIFENNMNGIDLIQHDGSIAQFLGFSLAHWTPAGDGQTSIPRKFESTDIKK